MKKLISIFILLFFSFTSQAFAARLWSCGFELNSTTAGVETDLNEGTIDATINHGGLYSCKINPSPAATKRIKYYFKNDGAAPSSNLFFRFYLRIGTAVSAQTGIFEYDTSGEGTFVGIRLKTDNTLVFYYNNASAVRTAIGSPSAALNLNQWYRIEVNANMTSYSTSVPAEAKIDGTTFASSTINDIRASQNGTMMIECGIDAGAWGDTATGNLYFDDIAVNDATGSFQNTYPGAGQIIHLHPNAAGDANGFLVQVGGTAGSTNNFTRVDEVTPDNATTYNASVVLNAEDLLKCGASGIGASDTVNVVSVGGRFTNIIADATSAFKFEIEKAASGTISQSAAIIPNSTTWKTNATVAPFNYPIILYQDPDSSNWTQATLDTMQIGYKITTANVNTIAISTVWALVDYTPSSVNKGAFFQMWD